MVSEDVLAWLLNSDPSIRWQVMDDLTDQTPEVIAEERSLVATTGWGADILSRQGPDGQWGRDGYQHLLDPDAIPDASGRVQLRELQRVDAEGLAGFMGVDLETVAKWETDPLDHDDETTGRYLRFLAWARTTLGTYNPKWISTTYTLLMLHHFGLDPDSPQARAATGLVAEKVKWDTGDEVQGFFQGETEGCVNGMVVTTGSYFDHDVDGVVERLLSEQLDDGGWNCEIEYGSTRSSFHTTISVLEAFLEYERRNGPNADLVTARRRGEEYLLDRRMMRKLSTGEIVDPAWTAFSFPPRWHYDVLRGLDYMRAALDTPDQRCDEAVELVASKQGDDGRWIQENTHPGMVHFDVDEGDGSPSRWNTLRALRVLNWFRPG